MTWQPLSEATCDYCGQPSDQPPVPGDSFTISSHEGMYHTSCPNRQAQLRWMDWENGRRGHIHDLVRAVLDEGPKPAAHRQIMARHRREWPTLWRAIDAIIADQKGPSWPS